MDGAIELVIRNRTGLHARPAKEFVNLAKRFAADIRVHHGGRKANGKSLVSLLTLGVKRGSAIRVEADGADRDAALRALAEAVEAGLGEGVEGAGGTPAQAPSPAHTEFAHPGASPPRAVERESARPGASPAGAESARPSMRRPPDVNVDVRVVGGAALGGPLPSSR